MIGTENGGRSGLLHRESAPRTFLHSSVCSLDSLSRTPALDSKLRPSTQSWSYCSRGRPGPGMLNLQRNFSPPEYSVFIRHVSRGRTG